MSTNSTLRLLLSLVLLGTLFCCTAGAAENQTAITPQSQTGKESPLVVIYTLSTCPHCAAAKAYMTKRNIPFVNREVDTDDEHMAELMKIYDEMKVPEARRGVPLLVIGGKIRQQGFNEDRFEKALAELSGK